MESWRKSFIKEKHPVFRRICNALTHRKQHIIFLSDQSIALKNGVGDIAAMAKSSFVHTPKNKRHNLEWRL